MMTLKNRQINVSAAVLTMRVKIERLAKVGVNILSSNSLFWIIFGLLIFQALWVAFSFRYPMLYDEKFHLDAIRFLSSQGKSFLIGDGSQNTNYDFLGSIVFGATSIFHYIMAAIYWVANHFNIAWPYLTVIFRVLNIAMVAFGLYAYRRLFQKLKIGEVYINLGLLMFVLLPMTTLVAATVNYDNMIFLLTPLFLIAGINVLQLKEPKFIRYVIFMVIGLFASLAKPAFLPVFAVGCLIAITSQYRLINHQFIKKLLGQISGKKIVAIPLLLLVGVLLVLFAQRYVYSTIRYGSPIPDCAQVLSSDRCMANGVYALESMVIATKNDRSTITPTVYVAGWFNSMFLGYGITAANTTNGGSSGARSPEILNDTIFILAGLFVLAMVYQRKSEPSAKSKDFVLYCAAALVLVTICFNAVSYYRAHSQLNLNPRYILSVLPIFFVFGIRDLSRSIGNRPLIKITIITVLFVIFAQGGGLITHIVKSNEAWYWQNPNIIRINQDARNILNIVVR